MNPKKRILSILLGILLMLSILPAVSLADDAAAPTISFELADPDAVIKPGDAFAVNMVIANNPGIAAFQARIEFDKDAMDLTNIVAKTDDATFLLNQGNFIPATNMGYVEPGNGTNFGWIDATGISADGILCQLQFKAKEDAAEGSYSVALDTRETSGFELTSSGEDMAAITPNTTPCTFYLGTPTYGIFARSGEAGAYKYTEVTDTDFMLNTASNLDVAPWKDTATLVLMNGIKVVDNAQWTIKNETVVQKDADAAEEAGAIHLKATGSTPGSTTELTVTSGDTTLKCNVKIANYARAITNASMKPLYGASSYVTDHYVVSTSRKLNMVTPMTDVAGNAITDTANAGEITWKTTGGQSDMRVFVNEQGELESLIQQTYSYERCTATPVVKGYVDGVPVELEGNTLNIYLNPQSAEALTVLDANGKAVPSTYEVDGALYPLYTIPADGVRRELKVVGAPEGPKEKAGTNVQVKGATSENEEALTVGGGYMSSQKKSYLGLKSSTPREEPYRVAVRFTDSWDGSTTGARLERTAYIYVKVREPVKAETIALDQTELSMMETRKVTLTATLTPADNDYPEITWESADKTIATVDSKGTVTAVKAGETTITATNTRADGTTVTATCTVTVTPIDYTDAKLCISRGGKWEELNLAEGQELLLANKSSYDYWTKSTYLGFMLKDGQIGPDLKYKLTMDADSKAASTQLVQSNKNGELYLNPKYENSRACGGTLEISTPNDEATVTLRLRRGPLPVNYGMTYKYETAHGNEYLMYGTGDEKVLVVPDGFVLDLNNDLGYTDATGGAQTTTLAGEMPYADIQWTADDPSVAAIGEDGKVTFHTGETRMHLKVSAFVAAEQVTHDEYQTLRVVVNGNYSTGAKLQLNGRDLAVNDSYRDGEDVIKVATVYVGTKTPVTLNVVPLPEGSNTIAVNSVTIEEGFQSSSPRNISASVDKDNNTVVLQGLKANTGLQRLRVSVKFNNPDNEDYYTKSYVLYARVVNTVFNLTGLKLEDFAVKVGGTEEVEPEFTPASASDKAVTWSIEDETIATVDENGVVTGIKEGETKLTCTSVSFPDVTATCTVRVVFDSTGYTIAARGTNENGETVYNPIGESNPLILNAKTVEPWKSTAELYLLNAKGEICENVEWSVAEGSELRKAETQPENGLAIDATGLADGTTTAVSVAHRNVTFTCPVQVKDYYFTATSAPSFDIKAPFIGQVQGNELFANTNSGHTFTFTLKDELTAAQKAAQTLEFVPSVEGGGTSTANSDGTYTFAVGNGEYDFTLNVHATGSRDGAPYSASLSSAAAFKCHVGASIPAKVGFEQPNIYGTFTGLYNYQTVTINNLVNSKLCKVSGNAYVGLATQGETTEFKIVATPEESQSQVTINSIVATDSSDMTFERTGDQSFTITMSDTAPSGKVIGSVTVTGTRVVNGKTYTFKQPMYVKVNSGTRVEYLTVNAPKNTIEVGETMQLTTVIKPRLAANAYVYWQSSDPSVVSVDQNGLVTGLKEGSWVTITASAGSKTASAYIWDVKAKGTPKAVMSTNLEEGAKLKPGDTFHLYVDLVNVPASGFDVITAKIRPDAWKKTPYFTAAAGSTENLLGSDVEGYAPKLEYNLNGGDGPSTWMAVMELDMSASESNITGDGRLMDILVTVGKDAQKATDTVYEFNPLLYDWSCDGTDILDDSYEVSASIIVEGAGSTSKPTAVTIGSDSASNVACVGGEIVLTANVMPAGVSQTVVWSTEDTDIISIASADEIAANSMEVTANRIKVTALKEGTATVTATAGEVSTTYTLTIVEKQIGLTAAIDGTQTIDKGETANVRVRIDSDNAEETYNAFELIVSYDKDKLTYAGSDADDSANRFVKDNEDGTLTIYGYGDSITAGTELATLQFTGTAAGKANVALTSAKANESDVAIRDDLQTINISAAQKTAVVTIVDAVTVTFEGGTVNGGKTKLLVENGELSFTVDPVEGKDVQSVLVNGAALQPNAQGAYELSGVTTDTTVTITFKMKTYKVEFTGNGKDDADGEPTATHGETYGFTLNEQAGYKYDIKVTVDGQELSDVTGTSIPGRYVTGNIVIEITKTAISVNDYSVKVWRNGVEQTGEETTVTQNANEYKFQYDAAKWKLMNVTMGGTEVAVADDNGSVTVNGPITGNLAIYYAGIYKVTLPEAGVNADKDSAIYGEDFTFTVDDGYTLTEVTINGEKYEVTPNEDGSYTIKGEDITGDVVITVDVPEYQVEVYEYVKLENKASVMLIVAKADLAEGKALYYDGNMMFHSNADAYDGYAYLQIIGEGETLTKEEAAKKITQSAGTPVEIDYGGDVNMSQRTDLNDAQLAYDIYMAKYNSLDGQVSMEKFLRADVNVDHCVDATDARAIADDVYQK